MYLTKVSHSCFFYNNVSERLKQPNTFLDQTAMIYTIVNVPESEPKGTSWLSGF